MHEIKWPTPPIILPTGRGHPEGFRQITAAQKLLLLLHLKRKSRRIQHSPSPTSHSPTTNFTPIHIRRSTDTIQYQILSQWAALSVQKIFERGKTFESFLAPISTTDDVLIRGFWSSPEHVPCGQSISNKGKES